MPALNGSTYDRILEAAAELFVARAYADVTVDQVAEAAAVTKGAVYHYFESKQDLYIAMLLADLADKRERHRAAAELEGSAAARLRALTRAFLSLPDTRRRMIRLIRRDANIFNDKVRAQLVRAYQEALPDHVEAILRDGIAAREIIPCDPKLLAWQYIAMFEVLMTPYADRRFGCQDDKLNFVLGVFLDGCARATRCAPPDPRQEDPS